MLCGVHGVELHAEADAFAISGEDVVQESSDLLWTMDVQVGSPAQKRHGTDEAWQSKDVVTMVVGDEDVPDACHGEFHALHLYLCSFSAVYHEVFGAEIHYLCCGQVLQGGFGRAASQYVYSECFHRDVFWILVVW